MSGGNQKTLPAMLAASMGCAAAKGAAPRPKKANAKGKEGHRFRDEG